jgi:hypothetical protein
MKKLLLSIASALLAVAMSAQVSPTIDFETIGIDSAWFVFANVTDNPAYCAVADNPDAAGLNTSAKVGMLEVLTAANPWAGMYSITSITPFKWSTENAIVKVLVYKDVVSDFDLKFEALVSAEWAHELKVANTLTNEWEELTFDFSAYIGDTNTISRIVIIPDFPATRSAGSMNYFDNIKFGSGGSSSVDVNTNSVFRFYPNPVKDVLYISGRANTVVSIYNIMGTRVLNKVLNSANEGIDVSNLISGIYMIKPGNQTERLVVR